MEWFTIWCYIYFVAVSIMYDESNFETKHQLPEERNFSLEKLADSGGI